MKQPRPLLALALLIPLVSGTALVAKAQPPGGDPFDGGPLFDDGPRGQRPPGEGGPGGPGGRRGPHGVKGRLEGTWRGIQRLQSQDKSLSKAQANKLVSLVKPWASRASMSDTDARKLVQSLEAVLTSAQRSKLGPPRGGPGGPDRGGGDFGPPPPDGGPGGPPPGGDFGPPDQGGDRRGEGREPGGPGQGGPGGPGGPRGRMALPASFNPFYAPTGRSDWKKLPTSTQQLLARRYRDNRAVLESLSRFAKS